MDWDEALELLKGGEEGIAEWNRRRGKGEQMPRLSGANLSDARLAGVDLSSAALSSAHLVGADLSGANLSGANLSEADLSGANLRHAIFDIANLFCANFHRAHLRDAWLYRVDLRGANLRGADLRRTILGYVELGDADLTESDLSDARCGRVTFSNVNLSETKGLDLIHHSAPSTVGIDTVFRSKGRIPDAFLRGCGVPESFIQTLPLSLNSMEAIQYYSCFISYSSKDQAFVERLYADLQARGVRTWFDRENIRIGDKLRAGINDAIRVHDKLMLVLSEQSIASDWVEEEVETALERERQDKRTVLFPIRLDDSVMVTPVAWASHVRRRHIGDFRAWENPCEYQTAFARLLRDLNSIESTGTKRS
jgi:hypothetical protein